MSSLGAPLGIPPNALSPLLQHGVEGHACGATSGELPNGAGDVDTGLPAESLGGIKLLPEQKAQCVCGRVINRSSIYRHAIAGDGQCSGGSTLSEQDIAAMRHITFLAKASYMRDYREKVAYDRRSRGAVVSGADRAGMLLDGQLVMPIRKAGAVASKRNLGMGDYRHEQSSFGSNYVDDMEGESAKCPSPACGRIVRARNLFEHVSSKTCNGGHLLSAAQLADIKSVAKAARVKHKSVRKVRQPDAIDVSESLDPGAIALPHAAHTLGGDPNMITFFPHPSDQQNAGGIASSDPLLSTPNVLDLSIREIASMMARVVCRGHSDEEKKILDSQIVEGVESYRLTALVLLAKKPSAEVSAWPLFPRSGLRNLACLVSRLGL
jgi:hypothetical protein